MEVNEALIKRFLQNLCSVEEAEQVWKYLQEHPEAMDAFLPEGQQDDSTMDPIKKEALLLKIKERIQVDRPVRRKLWSASVAAAAILLISAIGFWMSKEPAVDPIQLAQTHTLVHINSGNEDLELNSSDGSTILLKPKSELRYQETFDGDKRDFHLKGAARFQVAKDTLRPFHVYAGGTLTTALGTDFTVSAFDAEAEVMIALHSGKVVVQPTNSVLKPGDQLFVNTTTLLARMNPLPNTSISLAGDAKNKAPKERNDNSLLSFANEPLDALFSRLETEFSIVIDYDPKLIKNRFFTGSFKRGPHMENEIIQTITQLNGLHFTKENNRFKLTP